MALWNPWHGCRKISEGCQNCYVYRIDARHGRDASRIAKNRDFNLPLRATKRGGFALMPGEMVYTCFSSDFLLEEADEWRPEAWAMMRARPDLGFFFPTKRIARMREALPPDWGDGYPNVTVCCTAENQRRADERLPILRDLPARRKCVLCEPLLGPIDLTRLLGPWALSVTAGGESGPEARVCRHAWVLSLREQCLRAGVPFHFKQTGANFEKDGRLYRVPRARQAEQARRAALDTGGEAFPASYDPFAEKGEPL